MSWYQCLSAAQPCLSPKVPGLDVCQLCKDSTDCTRADMEQKLVYDAVRVLTSRGYRVEPPQE